jgi:hypothetical protein
LRIEGDFFCATADPGSEPGGIPHDQRVVRNITRYNGSSGHRRPSANHQARQDDRPRTDTTALSEHHFGIIQGMLLAAWPQVMGKESTGSDKDIVFHGDSIPKVNAALQGHPVAQNDLILDENVVADVAVFSDPGAWQYVGKGPDARARAYDSSRINERLWMNLHSSKADILKLQTLKR